MTNGLKNNQGNKGFIVASNNKKYPRVTNQTSERFVWLKKKL